jgi:hypothetical protein
MGLAGIPASVSPNPAIGGRLLWRLRKTSDVAATDGNTGLRIEQVPLAIG